MNNLLRFRYPSYSILVNTLIIFFVLWTGSMILYPVNTVSVLFLFLVGVLIFCVIEFFIINLGWNEIVFDRSLKKLTVKKKILFYTVKQYEAPYGKFTINLDKNYESTGREGGWVWVLYLESFPGRKAKIASSPLKKGLEKKKAMIEHFIDANN